MGGYSTITQSPEEFPQEISNQMRRRGLIPALAGIQPSAGTDRVADDPATRANPEAYGATTPAQSPTSASPTNPLTEKMWEEYNKLGQPEPAPAPPSLKDRLLRGLLMAAPVAAGALGGGAYGAAGAAQGENQAIQRQQGMRLAQQQMAQQHQQQRDSLRERMLQEILQQQRMQQQNQEFQQRESDTESRLSQQIGARSDLEKQTAAARDAETQKKQDFQAAENEKKRKFEGEQADKKEALRREEDDKKFGLMMQKMGSQTPGSWSMAEDPNTGKPVLFNSKTGETKAAPPGVGPKGAYQKNLGGAIDAQNFAQDYLSRGVFTGPGDEALQEKFFELAKPSTGFRMTQPQIDQLRNSRNWMNSVQGHLHHATTGTWFSDTQRQQIVATMNELAEAKKRAQAAQSGGGQPAPAAGNDPLGILK